MSAKSIAGVAGLASAVGLGLGYLLGSGRNALPKRARHEPISKRLGLDQLEIDWNDKGDVRRVFIEGFEPLCEAFLVHVGSYGVPPKFIERLRKMMKYNVIGGKCIRGIVLMNNTRELCKHQGLDFSTRFGPALVLGWCIEILQASFLVADDVMDNSITRRGQPCWFRLPDIKLDAVNDSLILESLVFWLIKQEFGDSENKIIFFDLFRDVTFKTEVGQMLDLSSQPQGVKGPEVLKNFSSKLLRLIVDYKTAFYTFYAPIACSMVLTGLSDPKQLKVAEEISCLLGEKFQAQDDYLDCFGDPEYIGKIGTDIQDHKCTWLLVQALDRVDQDEMNLIERNLGVDDPSCIAEIKKLYVKLGLEEVYCQYEERTFEEIQSKISSNEKLVPAVAFNLALQFTHKRSK